MFKKIMSLFLVHVLVLCIGVNVYAADECEEFNERIYEDTKELIRQSIQTNSANEEYLIQVMEQLEYINDDDEYNDAIVDSARAIILQDEQANSELEQARLGASIQTRGDASDGYYSALSSYNAGIAIVRAAGCPNTADYMAHAIVPWNKVHTTYSPSNWVETDTDWAFFLTTTDDLFYEVTARFEEEILMTGKSYGTITGSHEFTTGNSSLDALAALHLVNYTVTFSETSNGYAVTFKLTDTYDFDWSNYNNFALAFGNNYCLSMQTLRYIRPFNITIICHQ